MAVKLVEWLFLKTGRGLVYDEPFRVILSLPQKKKKKKQKKKKKKKKKKPPRELEINNAR